jgi:signal transduction histidine kinase
MDWFMFLQYRISMLFLLAFLLAFLPLKHSKILSLCIAAVCFAVTGAGDYLRFFAHTVPTVLDTVLQAAVVQLTAYALCRYRDLRVLFLGITSAVYVLYGNIVCSLILIATGSAVWGLAAQTAVHFVLLLFLVRGIRDRALRALITRGQYWGRMCFVPLLLYLATYALSVWPCNIYEVPQCGAAGLFLMCLTLVTYVLIVTVFAQQQSDSELRHNNELLETYASGLRSEADQLRASEEKIAILRHDTRHRVELIEAYLDAGQTDKIRELLHSINDALRSGKAQFYCKNVAINGIVSQCVCQAGTLGVRLEMRLDCPEKLGKIGEFELATVVSNLLENALHAASELPSEADRTVHIQCFPVKAQLLLEVSNPYAGTRAISRETGLPVSRRGVGHGYGLRSVRTFAEKNHAVFTYSTENQIFCVRLLAEM